MHEVSWSVCAAQLQALAPGTGLVFVASPLSFELPAAIAQLERAMVESERERMGRFRFPVDQHIYRVAHGLLRMALGSMLKVPPNEVTIKATDRGRPELVGSQAASALRFNLSHTKGLVACAFARGGDVGVDVEDAERRADMAALARTVLSDAEQADLSSLTGDARRARFFELWTLKESYIKAVGHGLGLPLKSVSFAFSGAPPVEHATVTFGPGIDDQADRLRYLCRPLLSNHQLSLALPASFDADVPILHLGPSAAAEVAGIWKGD